MGLSEGATKVEDICGYPSTCADCIFNSKSQEAGLGAIKSVTFN